MSDVVVNLQKNYRPARVRNISAVDRAHGQVGIGFDLSVIAGVEVIRLRLSLSDARSLARGLEDTIRLSRESEGDPTPTSPQET